MKYSIQIDYTGNEERAGKMTITDSNGQALISKAPVSVPSRILENNLDANSLTVTLEVKDTKQKKELLSHPEYESISNKFKLMALDSVILTNIGFAIIPNIPLGNNKERLNATQDAFVLHESDFLKLKKEVNEKTFDFKSNGNTFDLTLNKVMLLWFPEKVNTTKKQTSVVSALRDLDSKEQDAIIRIEANNNKTSINTQNPVKNHQQTKIDKEVPPKNNEKVSFKTNSQLHKEDVRLRQEQQRAEEERLERQRRDEEYRRRNDLDALDIVLMYNNPELAPIFKPNSMLAWALYFNQNNHEVNSTEVRESLKTIPGFENVENSEVRYSASGYSVAMYEDEQKQKLIGTLVHDAQNNSFSMQTPEGSNTTTLSFDDNGDAKGSVYGEKGTTNFDLIQNPNGGFTGNWESESSEGIKISSGVSLGQELSNSMSTPFEPVDLSSAITSRDEYRDTMKYEPEPETAPKWEPPPPPPPPPPEDDMRWSSTNDSYANSSSFSP